MDIPQVIPKAAAGTGEKAGDETRAIAAGCDAFHTKPVVLEKLFDQINKPLGETTADAEAEPS